MKPIIKWTLWQRRFSILWWSIGVIAFIALSLGFYATFKNEAQQLTQALDKLPSTAKAFISGSNSLDLASPRGFLSARLYYLMLPLLLSVLAIGLGSGLIAKEEESTTLELLLSRPASRGRALLGKAITGLIVLLLVSLISLAATITVCQLVGLNEPIAWNAMATLTCAVMALLFGAVALTISALGKGARSASMGLAVLVALGGYIVVSLSGVVEWLRWPAKIFPYNYYRPDDVLAGNINWPNVAGMLVATIILVIVSWLAFRRRDLGV